MLPLYGFVQGDTIGLLILAEESDTVEILGQKLQQAASVRVPPADDLKLVYKGQVLDTRLTISQAGFGPLERFDLIREDGP